MAKVTGEVETFCLRILESGDLEDKLAPAPASALRSLSEKRNPHGAIAIDRPARSPALRMSGGASRLPRLHELADGPARATCLARFAHHELMAVELFAWALLRWPEVPAGLRRALLVALCEEQTHCRLYLDRLEAHGHGLGDFEHSDYFWKHAPAIAASPHGPRAFLSAMGLTLEQANLDFSLLYRDAFRAAGDEESALACQRVHDDEIGHVALAARWLRRLSPAATDALSLYLETVPFPLSAARAKARCFDLEGRRRAGLDEAFIEYVRRARPSQERRAGHSRVGGEGRPAAIGEPSDPMAGRREAEPSREGGENAAPDRGKRPPRHS